MYALTGQEWHSSTSEWHRVGLFLLCHCLWRKNFSVQHQASRPAQSQTAKPTSHLLDSFRLLKNESWVWVCRCVNLGLCMWGVCVSVYSNSTQDSTPQNLARLPQTGRSRGLLQEAERLDNTGLAFWDAGRACTLTRARFSVLTLHSIYDRPEKKLCVSFHNAPNRYRS